MTLSVKEKLEAGPMFDAAIVEHHFTPYMRDYDIIVDVPAAVSDNSRSYIAARVRYRFSHCVMAQVTTALPDETWRLSWTNEFIDYKDWDRAGNPPGFVWGVCWSNAYPGLTYVGDSDVAREWSDRLGHPMHEITIGTNSHLFRLIFHDVTIVVIAKGDPDTDELRPV
jgi:hypothetical protein